MPERKHKASDGDEAAVAPVRSIWSGTITFGLVSIPVDLLSAVQARHTAMNLVDKEGNRDEYSGSLGVNEFDRLWEKIDGAGWRYLKDCEGTGQPGDPVFNFDVKDWNQQAAFACTNAGPLPYPYNTIVDELDFKAAAAQPKDRSKPDPEDLK